MTCRPLFALVFALWAAALARDAGDTWVAATALPELTQESSIEVLARDGRLLRAYTVADGRWRMAVAPGLVDPGFIEMLIAYEDKRFYSHVGVDPLALLRAGWQAAWSGRIVSGGSTLTMQVARLLENSGTGRLTGKLRQARLALALERRLSKDQILGLYLHIAPYGGNLEGVRAAALAYFGKEARRLTPAERALLVALPQAPETRRPDRFAQEATAARAKVLRRAVAAGIIAADQAQAALREPVPTARRDFPALAPHLTDRVVAASPGQNQIRLTIDAGLQARLEELAAVSVAAQGDKLQIAMVVADHRSGEVLASVGSAAYRADGRQGFVDMTQALRSPGSTLKPLVYGLAFDEGLAHPETLIEDRPRDFGGYAPQNFDKTFRGTLRVREALQLSLNIPVVALTEALGPAKLLAAMRRAGVQAKVPGGQPGLAVALGGLGVTLQDMVQLYASLARGGVALPLRATSQAGVGQAGMGARVISDIAAWQVANILSGLAPPPGAPENRLAYKTGTSYGHRDTWAIGFDGAHVIGIWMGRADGTPVPGAFGAEIAAPVLFQAFARLKPMLEPLSAAPAATLIVSNAELPQPLRNFRSRNAVFKVANAPVVAFPPDGAEVELLLEGLLLRVRGGTGPFTWLANGRPVAVQERARATVVALQDLGFVTLSVVDAKGLSAKVDVRLR
jgi:penicillin-binding protein 1C